MHDHTLWLAAARGGDLLALGLEGGGQEGGGTLASGLGGGSRMAATPLVQGWRAQAEQGRS